MNAILAAAVNYIHLCRIPIAAKIDSIEELGSPDVVRFDARAVCGTEVRVGHRNNPVLCALHRIAGNGYARRSVNQNPRGSGA